MKQPIPEDEPRMAVLEWIGVWFPSWNLIRKISNQLDDPPNSEFSGTKTLDYTIHLYIIYIYTYPYILYRLFHKPWKFLHPGTLTPWVQNISQGSHYHGRATWKARPTSSRRVSWMKNMPFCLGGGSNVNFRQVLVDNKWPNKSSVFFVFLGRTVSFDCSEV